jgi:chemotaxis protein methyltransferase CheR
MKADTLESLEMDLLLEAVWRHYGVDFRRYAATTVYRRLRNMAQEEGLRTLSGLQERVLHEPSAMERLLQHLAVNATSMFRDPSFFLAFRQKVVPALRDLDVLRVWHAGCATGEEVHSMAILLHEQGLLESARLYATDMNQGALERAKQGIYPLRLMREFTENYLLAGGQRAFSDYYVAQYDSAVMKGFLRKNTLFAQHNLAVDRSFNEFQVVLCRNVLIYFDCDLQQHVHELLHASLAPRGFLALGHSEALPRAMRDRYEDVDPREHIYRRLS